MNESIRQTQKLLPNYTSDKLIFASTANERENLWAARKEALWALLAMRPENTEIWSTDVAVPISRLAEIVGMYFFSLLTE
jgi:D-lactate dehydrogenase (cytochrome)